MADFYKGALKKLDKLNTEQRRELLLSAIGEINLLANVFDSIDVGILVCDENNKLVLTNKYAQRLLPMNSNDGVLVWLAIEDERIVEFLKETLINRYRVMDKEIDITL